MSQKPLQPPSTVPNGTGSPFLDQQILLNQQLAAIVANASANFTDLYASEGGGGGGNVIRNGSGAPANSLGNDGDFYIDTVATKIYGPRASGIWPSGIPLVGPQGNNGTSGNTVNHGTGSPGSGVGSNGDFYIDTAANNIYGPKSAGVWGSGSSLVGPQGSTGSNGNTVLNGSGTPSSGIGNNGDFYVDPTALQIYGPKSAGAWTAGTSLTGVPNPPAGQTLRNIASRCRINQAPDGTAVMAAYSRTGHYNMGDPLTQIQVVHGNWYANNAGEANGPAAETFYVSLEWPVGVFTMATFSGAQSAVCAPGTNIITDFIKPLTSIPTGALFYIRTYVQTASAVGIPLSMSGSATPLDSLTHWTTLVSQTNDPRAVLTGSNAAGGSAAGGVGIFPLAILGMSSVPSVIVYGDSRCGGVNDQTGSAYGNADFSHWGLGEICRSIGQTRPYCNCGIPSDTIAEFNLSNTLRTSLAQYHQYVHFQYGTNDIVVPRTGATVMAALQSAYALFPTKKVSQSTIPPRNSSTDAFATLANQTIDPNNTQRAILNNLIRATPSPLWKYFEVADVVESARDSGLWKAPTGSPGITLAVASGDGIHESAYGYTLIQTSGAINSNLFT